MKMALISPIPESLAQAARESLTLTRCIILLVSLSSLFVFFKITKLLFFGKLKHIPGPTLSSISGVDLSLATLQGRRAYVRCILYSPTKYLLMYSMVCSDFMTYMINMDLSSESAQMRCR